ncbi:hypothetical protein B5P43_36675 [Bacillus sp. SRB_336]|nr:hypothetical protein B5P43_36675 [Bacillus sp. SRB_336]
MTALPDFYAVLHLDRQATGADVGRAYRSLMRRHHPDTRPVPDTPGEAAAERELLAQIMDAHAALADPVQRARYDRSATGSQPREAAGAGHEVFSAVPSQEARASRPPAPLYGPPPIVAGPVRWEPSP